MLNRITLEIVNAVIKRDKIDPGNLYMPVSYMVISMIKMIEIKVVKRCCGSTYTGAEDIVKKIEIWTDISVHSCR